MPTHTVRLPAPQSDEERDFGRDLGYYLNPSRRPTDADHARYGPLLSESVSFPPDFAPDAPLLASLFALARSLWLGEAATVTVPLDADPDEPMTLRPLEFIAHHTNPAETDVSMHDTGTGVAMRDLYYATKGALNGTSAEWVRAGEVASDALWAVGVVAFQPRSDDGGMSLSALYEDQLIEGQDRLEKIRAQREKFEMAVARARTVMDAADQLVTETTGR